MNYTETAGHPEPFQSSAAWAPGRAQPSSHAFSRVDTCRFGRPALSPRPLLVATSRFPFQNVCSQPERLGHGSRCCPQTRGDKEPSARCGWVVGVQGLLWPSFLPPGKSLLGSQATGDGRARGGAAAGRTVSALTRGHRPFCSSAHACSLMGTRRRRLAQRWRPQARAHLRDLPHVSTAAVSAGTSCVLSPMPPCCL